MMEFLTMIYTVFQFLIGTLKTGIVTREAGIGREFQFLIGTLKTAVDCFNYYTFDPFQFLIGTLKTPFILVPYHLQTAVSIPHRYAKNLCLLFSVLGLLSSFNSS